jgi:hypothetical protein
MIARACLRVCGRRQAAPFPVEVDCNGPYPLDFGEFEAFDRYQQIYTFQEKASGSPGQPRNSTLSSLPKPM